MMYREILTSDINFYWIQVYPNSTDIHRNMEPQYGFFYVIDDQELDYLIREKNEFRIKSVTTGRTKIFGFDEVLLPAPKMGGSFGHQKNIEILKKIPNLSYTIERDVLFVPHKILEFKKTEENNTIYRLYVIGV